MENKTNKKIAILNSTKEIKNLMVDFVKPYANFNSNKAVKVVAKEIFDNFAINEKYDDENGFAIICKIKSEDYLKLNELKVVKINKNLTLSVNIFEEIFKTKFIDMLKNINVDIQKKLLSKAICYTLNNCLTLKNTIKYYKDNNLKPTVDDLLTKNKLSIYQVFVKFASNIIDFVNTNNQ